jgi:hypothetical protein
MMDLIHRGKKVRSELYSLSFNGMALISPDNANA